MITAIIALVVVVLLAILSFTLLNTKKQTTNSPPTITVAQNHQQEHPKSQNDKLSPVSVNYHFTRKCNYECGFCFHTAKNSFVLPLEDAKKGLRMLAEAGMKKLNFSGGEPFLYPEFLGQLCQFAKEELQLPSISIICNGSKVTRKWMERYSRFVNIFAVSCDSFDENTNARIGRGKGRHLETVQQVADWCREFGVRFKLNSVINAHNWQEDMNEGIRVLDPERWKVFQVLVIQGENSGSGDDIRDATSFTITGQQFASFLDRHRGQPSLVPEDNSAMRTSYVILDEYMRFLDCSDNKKEPSESILTVGVESAFSRSGFDLDKFTDRRGFYDWTGSSSSSPSSSSPCSSGSPSSLVDMEDLFVVSR